MERTQRDTFRAAMHGDRDAFDMIIRIQSRPLFAIAYGILQNREEAEDVVQDAFVKAWRSRWRVRDPEKFPAWLGTIARHRAHDLLRRRRSVPLDEQLSETVAPEVIDSDEDHDRQARVHSALATLPELHRSALMLRYLDEMDYAAIEQTLGLSNGALRGILGRALAAMRKQLKPALAAMH
ncbi:MAG TPA: sigma-70 family RNA polymerase sigma factor [Chthoniobacterales bacterium]|nr:sigma-70 family RNA polymerase sigma factor [Chthoniobacterales bacterium]